MPHRGVWSPGSPSREVLARTIATCMAAGLPSIVQAATSASFQASATIVSGCEINGALPADGQAAGQIGMLDFGDHSALSTGPVSASLMQNAGLVLSCTPSVALTMTIDGGLHGDASRNLQASGSADRLAYRLYGDAGFNQELLANQAFPVSFSVPAQIILPVYGRLTLPGNSPPDTYADTVVVTLSW